MPPITCNFASALYDRMVPLASDEVRTPGLNINFIEVEHPRDIFDRMVANREFDASEPSALEYITRHVSGDRSFVAIPVFPSRVFRHGFICVNTNTVKEPKDFNGKRVGVQLYTMTAAVWICGVLQHEYVSICRRSSELRARWKAPGRMASPPPYPRWPP